MPLLSFTVAVIFGLMLAETRVSMRHVAQLRTRGATMPAGDVFVWMAIVYPLAFLIMAAEGLWWPATGGGDGAPDWYAAGLVLFVAAKILKYWAIGTLGERWSFRVMVLPGAPLIRSGPYRFVTHPNYIAVIGELAGTAMMMRARITGPLMLAAFGCVLLARVRFENRVLEAIRAGSSS